MGSYDSYTTPERAPPGVHHISSTSALPSRAALARTPSMPMSVPRIAPYSSRRALTPPYDRYSGPGLRERSGGLLQKSRWKLLGATLVVLLLHMMSANIAIPLTHRLVGSTPAAQQSSGTRSLPGQQRTDSGGGIIRLLAESMGGGADASLTSEQAALLAKFGDKITHGRDVWVQHDGLTNPLVLPAADADALGAPDNIRKYAARKMHILHRAKCRNDTILPYASATGREWVTTSRGWTKAYGGGVSKYRWCRGGSNAEVPELKQVLLLLSNKTRHPRAVTIVTQLSLERTAMLEQQCRLWPFTIAAVVYIPLVRGKVFSDEDEGWHMEPLSHGVDAMAEFYDQMHSAGCVLDLEVVAEERCSRDLAGTYPANAVRNRALMLAKTDVVLLLDVDFVVDTSLRKVVDDEGRYAALLADLESRKVLVLPAFEAWDQGEWGRKVALDAVYQGKAYIAHKFMYNIVIGFHMSHYPQGHEKTNFWRWVNTTAPYEVEYQIGFEPYILMARKYVPYYDERFRGYYWNKVQHLMHISMQNRFTFVIHPDLFVVHIPHRKPATKWRTKRSGQKERNHVMFLEALEDIKRQRFVPVTAFPHLCLPPGLQRAAAAAVGNEQQRAALEEMAAAVVPLPGEQQAVGAGTPPKPKGEVAFLQERPAVVADAAAGVEQLEAARQRAARRAEELQRDLADLEELQQQQEVTRRVPVADRLAAAEAAEVEVMQEASAMMAGLQEQHAAEGQAGDSALEGGEGDSELEVDGDDPVADEEGDGDEEQFELVETELPVGGGGAASAADHGAAADAEFELLESEELRAEREAAEEQSEQDAGAAEEEIEADLDEELDASAASRGLDGTEGLAAEAAEAADWALRGS